MNNRKTYAEILANFHSLSAKGALSNNSMIEAFDGVVDTISESVSDIPAVAVGRPTFIQIGEHQTVPQFIESLVSNGLFIQISASAANKIKQFIGDCTHVTDELGTPYTFKSVSMTYTSVEVDIQSGIMALGSVPNFKWNRIVLFHYTFEDGRTCYYLATKVFASTNNIVPSDEANHLNLLINSTYGATEDDLRAWYLYSKDKASPASGIANAKAAFNLHYNLGFDPTIQAVQAKSVQELLALAFPSEVEGQSYDELAWKDELESLYAGRNTCFIDITSLLKIISENAVLNTINEYVTRSIGMLGGVAVISAFLGSITNPSTLIQNYVNQLKSYADSDAGFVSKFMALWADATTNSNGSSLGFANNDAIVPQLFLAGIIATAVTTAASIIGTVLSAIVTYVGGAIGVVVGAALFGIGSVVLNVIQNIDSTTYCGVDPGKALSAFNFAYFQLGDPESSFSGDIVDQIDEQGYAVISTAFSKTLLWRNTTTLHIESETHITPISYSDAQNIRAIINDSGILHRMSTDYVHYYLSGDSEALDYCREHLGAYTSDEPLGYDSADANTRDEILKEGYLFAFAAYIIFLLCHQPYPTVIQPFIGETASGWSDSNTADAIDCCFNLYGNNEIFMVNGERLNGNAGSWPSWRDISTNHITASGSGSPTYNYYWYAFRSINLAVIPLDTSPATHSNVRTEMSYIYSLMNYEEFADTFYPAAIPSYVYTMPLVDRVSFVVGTIVINALIATVATTTAIVTTKVRKAKQRSAAKHAAKAEAAWTKMTQNPDDPEAYDEYRKAVRSNNFAANFNGGDKLSKMSYWADAGVVEDGAGGANDPYEILERNQDKVYHAITNQHL